MVLRRKHFLATKLNDIMSTEAKISKDRRAQIVLGDKNRREHAIVAAILAAKRNMAHLSNAF